MAAKKTTKPALKKAKLPPGTRGAALVDAVIAKVLAGHENLEIPVPEPVPAAVLGKLRFADGSPLPPSLVRWLAFDGSWIARTFDWFDDPSAPEIVPHTIEELVRDHPEAMELWAPFYRELPSPMPKGLGLPLDHGSESLRFLFLAAPDADGEYPVLWMDNGQAPTMGVQSPGFDVWLAAQAGLVRIDDYGQGGAGYAAAMSATRTRVLGGKDSLECRPASEDSVAPPPRAPRTKKPRVDVVPAFVVPKGLKGDRLFKALVLAIEKEDASKIRAYLDAAMAEAPELQAWKNAALSEAVMAFPLNEPLVRELLSRGANPNATLDFFGRILCRTVAHAHRVRALEIMLEAGGDPNAHGNREAAPLCDAAAAGNLGGVKALLAHGANANGVDGDGRTALYGVGRANHITQEEGAAIAEVLIAAKASVHATDKNGETPLQVAIEWKRPGVAAVLLAHGADPSTAPTKGAAAIASAWLKRDLDLFALLRRHGARLDVPTGRKLSILDVTKEDGVTPAVLDVRLELDDRPQNVRFRVKSVRTWESRGIAALVRFLATSAAAGMAGSDVFAPSTGEGRVLPPGDVRELTKDRTDYDEKPFYEYEAPLVLAGVAPETLAAFVATLTKDLGPIAELSLVGERPLSHPASDRTVDAARVVRWLRGEIEGSPRLFPAPLPFPVTERGKKGRIFAVTFTEMPSVPALEGFSTAVTRAVVRFRHAGMGQVSATVTGNTVVWKEEASTGQPYAVDAAPIRAAVLNGLVKLGGVDRVEWALGVAGDEGTPTAGKGTLLAAWVRERVA